MTSSPRTPLPSTAILKSLFDYSPDTGVLTWKYRDGRPKFVGAHNARFAGRPAGSVRPVGGCQYLVVELDGRPRLAHRIAYKIMTGEEPPFIVDHINCNGLDNRWANLRPADDRASQGNRRAWHKRSLPKGVRPSGARFSAFMTRDRKFVHLGVFDTPQEASAAYMRAASEYFGAFARQ